MKLYSTRGTLTPLAPFDFEMSLAFLGEFQPMAGEQTLAPRTLTKTLELNACAIVFQLVSQGTVARPSLEYTLWSERKLDASLVRTALERIRFFLSLDDDLNPFYAIGARDARFAPVTRRFYGLHQVKFLTPFENALWAVLTGRTPIRVAHRVKAALIEQYGPRLVVDGTEFRAFPGAEQLSAVSPSALNETIKNERKTEYACAVSRAFALVEPEFLYHAPTDEVRAWLLGIRGIGAWSADFILLRGLGRMEHMRMTEYNLRGDPFGKAIGKVYGDGKQLTGKEREQLAGRYAAWQGYWAYYLRVNA